MIFAYRLPLPRMLEILTMKSISDRQNLDQKFIYPLSKTLFYYINTANNMQEYMNKIRFMVAEVSKRPWDGIKAGC